MTADLHEDSDSRRADILEEAVGRLRSGESLDVLMANCGAGADWLEPLLKMSVQVGELRESVPVAQSQASLSRFLAQAEHISSELSKPQQRWWVSYLGGVAMRGPRAPVLRLISVALGSVAVALLLAWLVLPRPWLGGQPSGLSAGLIPTADDRPLVANFTVSTGQGSKFSLSDHGGDIVVLYFGVPGCSTCAVEAPALGRIQEEFNHVRVKVVAINTAPWGSLNQWRGFWKRIGAGDVLWATDDDQTVMRLLGVTSLGTTIIIGRDGRISYRDAGATPYEILRAAIAQLL